VAVVNDVFKNAVHVGDLEAQAVAAVAVVCHGLAEVGVQHGEGHLQIIRPAEQTDRTKSQRTCELGWIVYDCAWSEGGGGVEHVEGHLQVVRPAEETAKRDHTTGSMAAKQGGVMG
jgi:hypothetical protein